MTISEFIVKLQLIRSQHGDLPVWIGENPPPIDFEVIDGGENMALPGNDATKVVIIR
jgi:hypothetical protein